MPRSRCGARRQAAQAGKHHATSLPRSRCAARRSCSRRLSSAGVSPRFSRSSRRRISRRAISSGRSRRRRLSAAFSASARRVVSRAAASLSRLCSLRCAARRSSVSRSAGVSAARRAFSASIRSRSAASCRSAPRPRACAEPPLAACAQPPGACVRLLIDLLLRGLRLPSLDQEPGALGQVFPNTLRKIARLREKVLESLPIPACPIVVGIVLAGRPVVVDESAGIGGLVHRIPQLALVLFPRLGQGVHRVTQHLRVAAWVAPLGHVNFLWLHLGRAPYARPPSCQRIEGALPRRPVGWRDEEGWR